MGPSDCGVGVFLLFWPYNDMRFLMPPSLAVYCVGAARGERGIYRGRSPLVGMLPACSRLTLQCISRSASAVAVRSYRNRLPYDAYAWVREKRAAWLRRDATAMRRGFTADYPVVPMPSLDTPMPPCCCPSQAVLRCVISEHRRLSV